ncbi:unnamed protein product, partial [Polarella glacialis]
MQRRCEEDGAGNVYDAAFSRSRKCWRQAQRLVEPLTLTRFHDFHGSSDPPNAILLLFRRSSGFLYFCRAAALTGDLIVQIKNLNSGRQAEGRLRLKATIGVSESLRLKFGSAGTSRSSTSVSRLCFCVSPFSPGASQVPARLPVIRAPPGPFELQEVTSEAVVEAERSVLLGAKLLLGPGSTGSRLEVRSEPDGLLAWTNSSAEGTESAGTLLCEECSLAEIRQRLTSLRYFP